MLITGARVTCIYIYTESRSLSRFSGFREFRALFFLQGRFPFDERFVRFGGRSSRETTRGEDLFRRVEDWITKFDRLTASLEPTRLDDVDEGSSLRNGLCVGIFLRERRGGVSFAVMGNSRFRVPIFTPGSNERIPRGRYRPFGWNLVR